MSIVRLVFLSLLCIGAVIVTSSIIDNRKTLSIRSSLIVDAIASFSCLSVDLSPTVDSLWIFLYRLKLISSIALGVESFGSSKRKLDSVDNVDISFGGGGIDVVYTWVNGTDPVWLRSKEYHESNATLHLSRRTKNSTNATSIHSNSSTTIDDDDTSSSNRYRDSNELLYSLRSLWKHASWVRHIYIVTDNQIPKWLDMSNPRVSIVPHEKVFKDLGNLPVFSSPAIEANIHRIEGLSDYFLYFNDDVFLGSATYPEDFLLPSSKVQKFYTSWDVPKCSEGCSDTWIGDGYCDKACNVTECNFDYPDCVNVTEKGSGGGDDGKPKGKAMCQRGCPDAWVGDKVCDSRCNNVHCAYDAGDCGLANVVSDVKGSKVEEGNVFEAGDNSTQQQHSTQHAVFEALKLPYGALNGYINLTDAFAGRAGLHGEGRRGEIDIDWKSARYDNTEIVQNAVLLKKHGMIIFMLRSEGMEMCGDWCEKKTGYNGTVTFQVDATFNGTKTLRSTFSVEVMPDAKADAIIYGRGVSRSKEVKSVMIGSCQPGLGARPGLSSVNVMRNNSDGEAGSLALSGELREDISNWVMTEAGGKVGMLLDYVIEFDDQAGAYSRGKVSLLNEGKLGLATLPKLLDGDNGWVSGYFRVGSGLEDDRLQDSKRKKKEVLRRNRKRKKKVDILRGLSNFFGKGERGMAEDGGGWNREVSWDDACSRFIFEVSENEGQGARRKLLVNGGLRVDLERGGNNDERGASRKSGKKVWYPVHDDAGRGVGKDVDGRDGEHASGLRGTKRKNSEENAAAEYYRSDYVASWLNELVTRLQASNWMEGWPTNSTAHEVDGDVDSKRFHGRRLDTFGDSVVHVNQIYHKAFGVKPRKVPAHMPHLINKHVVAEMQKLWPEEWAQTSRNRFRRGNDMQYSFSYFYYLTHRRELQLGLHKGTLEHFDGNVTSDLLKMVWKEEIDTDEDGKLSSNELRSLASLILKESPSSEYILKLEDCLVGVNRSKAEAAGLDYGDESLIKEDTVIKFADAKKCSMSFAGLQDFALNVANGSRRKGTIVKELDEVAFQMIGDDYNDTLTQLDSIRARRPKFICINDNMENPSDEVVELFQQFLESFFPKRSPFELEVGTFNTILRLEQWEKVRARVKVIIWGLGSALVILAVFSCAFVINVLNNTSAITSATAGEQARRRKRNRNRARGRQTKNLPKEKEN